MKTSDFDYHLPEDRIAQSPIEPRDHSKLLVLDRKTGTWQHQHFYDLGNFLKSGDLLVVNESKVFKARLETIDGIEIFLLRPEGEAWLVLAKPGRKLKVDSSISFQEGSTATVLEKREDGTVLLDFKKSNEGVFALADTIGHVPTPPYVQASEKNDAAYQTVYAKQVGSVAAPTAGFHFTKELIEKLKTQGIKFASVTLHVGLGTFRPIKSDSLEEHVMHEEWLDIPKETQQAIQDTKKNGGRVIAVGTTTVRALESGITHGFTNIFITPGYTFKVIDGLITNFHLPKSSLLVLISSLAGRELILKAYQDAIEKQYRFYSFGDAMFIV